MQTKRISFLDFASEAENFYYTTPKIVANIISALLALKVILFSLMFLKLKPLSPLSQLQLQYLKPLP